ncbi:Winged helix-turn-helix DNA-binding [Lachnospiraceae bacterium XPB1003]|nr:Winged helix-turn-helix DNA-binding [Lachnospiraceae bacterium XPB1003]
MTSRFQNRILILTENGEYEIWILILSVLMNTEREVEEKFGGGEPDRTILTLPLGSNNLPIRQSADSADLNERQQQILSVMENGKEYSSDEIAKLIGLKGSRTRQLLKELEESGKIESIGSTRGKRYIKHSKNRYSHGRSNI